MCGQCCANQDLIQLTTFELYRLALHLGLKPAEFFQKYCELRDTNFNPSMHLYIRTEDMACPFLKDNKCSVHLARPFACRAYPMRAFRVPVSEMKCFVHDRYPMLEKTCNIFKMEDDDLLMGDPDLLADQTISYWVDEAYFNLVASDGKIDLSVPYDAAVYHLQDARTKEVASDYMKKTGDKDAQYGAEHEYARIALTLQSISWNASMYFGGMQRNVSEGEGGCIGKYLLCYTEPEVYMAVSTLVQSGSMDLARTFVMDSKICPETAIVSAVYGSSEGSFALGFQLEVSKEKLNELTKDGTLPLYVFFLPKDGSTSQAAGLSLTAGKT